MPPSCGGKDRDSLHVQGGGLDGIPDAGLGFQARFQDAVHAPILYDPAKTFHIPGGDRDLRELPSALMDATKLNIPFEADAIIPHDFTDGSRREVAQLLRVGSLLVVPSFKQAVVFHEILLRVLRRVGQ